MKKRRNDNSFFLMLNERKTNFIKNVLKEREKEKQSKKLIKNTSTFIGSEENKKTIQVLM